MKFRHICCFVTACFFLTLSIHAKDKDDTSGQDASGLAATVETHGQSLATLSNQVTEVVDKFQAMNGEIGRSFKKISDQEKVIKDAATRLQVLEDKISMLTGQLQEIQTEGLLSPKSSTRFGEYQKYAKGLEYMNAKQFDQAIKEFAKFQAENPKSVFNSYAQFWVGEAYFMQADYPMAIKQYQRLLSENVKSAKAPTALYRQGLSFYFLNSFDDAKAFFAKVIRTYPQTIEAVQASSQIERINNIEDLKKQQEFEMKMVE